MSIKIKLSFLVFNIFLNFEYTNSTNLVSTNPLPVEIPVIKMIIGSIEYSDKEKLLKGKSLKDLQTRFGGVSCRTDQSGLYYFPCEHKLTEPIYLILTNGNYWDKKEENIHGKIIKLPFAKIVPEKKSKVFVIKESCEKVIIEEDPLFLENNNFEFPYEKSIVINVNPSYLDSIEKKSVFYTPEGMLVLPSLKLLPSKKAKLKHPDKATWRKLKHTPHYIESLLTEKKHVCNTKRGKQYVTTTVVMN